MINVERKVILENNNIDCFLRLKYEDIFLSKNALPLFSQMNDVNIKASTCLMIMSHMLNIIEIEREAQDQQLALK